MAHNYTLHAHAPASAINLLSSTVPPPPPCPHAVFVALPEIHTWTVVPSAPESLLRVIGGKPCVSSNTMRLWSRYDMGDSNEMQAVIEDVTEVPAGQAVRMSWSCLDIALPWQHVIAASHIEVPDG